MEDQTTYTEEDEMQAEEPSPTIEELESAKMRANMGMIIFIILFVLSLGLFAYYQFYQGGGHWKLTFKHKGMTDMAESTGPNAQMAALMAKNDSLTSLVTTLQQEPKTTAPSMAGTLFEVQIGAFRVFDPSKYANNYANMQFEKDGDLTKLTVGRFGTYAEASAFKADIRKMGIYRAWIVKKVEGQRQPVQKEDMK